MSARNSSSFLQPPSPVGVAGSGASVVGGQTQSSQQAEQSSPGVMRLHSVVTKPSYVATASTSNIFRSLSTIHRSTSILPASLLDLNVASTAGLQVIRPETHPEAFVPIPPDGGWGWLVVFAAFITNLIIDGICVSFGIMVADLVEHFNASVATVMLMGSLLLGVYQIVGPVAAGLVNRFGCRAVGIGGSLLATVSMFVSAFMPTIELMIVSYGVFAGAAFGFLHLPSIICVSFYFDSRRALAIGMTTCGTPIGAMIFAPLTEVLLQRYGWSNTLILFAGMLLNCMVLAALYRPLTPALLLTPMKASEAEGIKSLLQLAASEEAVSTAASGDRMGVEDATPPVVSQRDLRDQPVPEEDEDEDEDEDEEEEKKKKKKEEEVGAQRKVVLQKRRSDQAQPEAMEVGKDKLLQSQLETIAEGPEGEMETEGKRRRDARRKDGVKPRHHRHHRRRRTRETLRRQLQKQYAQWVEGIRRLRGSRVRNDGEMEAAVVVLGSDTDAGAELDEMGGESDASDRDSSVSTCGSSCEEEASHWDSASTSDVDEAAAKKRDVDDELHPLKKASRKQATRGGHRTVALWGRESTVSQREASALDCIVSAPSLIRPGKYSTSEGGWSRQQEQQQQRRSVRSRNQPSERRPSRAYTRPIPRQSVVRLANASVPRRRSESVAMGALTRSYLSSLGSTVFASTAGGFVGAGSGTGTRNIGVEDFVDAAPVIVELPHESISVEDYARPLYRKDIFFPGSVKRQIESSTASIVATVANMMETSEDQIGCSQASVEMVDGVRRRKTTMGTSLFGSNILFGDNVPLPPINEGIPLPDVFEAEDGGVGAGAVAGAGGVVEDEAKLWDQVKAETGLNLANAPADGIYRVPRSHSMCGWWLCWETRRKHSAELAAEEVDGMECLKCSLEEDGDRSLQPMKFPQRARLVLVRRCVFLPKSMFDVLMTMMNLSLLKAKSFLIFCLSSLIAVMGAYVPLFFVCDLADSFSIPKSQSAYLLTVYGGASVVSRLLSSWAASRPKVSSTLLSAVTLMLAGITVCVMPYWGSLIGQIILMVIYGLTVSPFFSLTSIIICDILDLEALTNAYGIVTMVRGVASTVGSPVAGMIVAATSTFSVALSIAGVAVIVGGVLYVVILCHERAKLNKLAKGGVDAEQGKV
ncbi:Monocarboxylate transporter 3 [Taenia crassiceps]|uniref:Monocarboxylate transporter 3 n=1 Tax=Taenia crassiceps TaxID=6207 RepID=A0ABR4QM24_9CEST